MSSEEQKNSDVEIKDNNQNENEEKRISKVNEQDINERNKNVEDFINDLEKKRKKKYSK